MAILKCFTISASHPHIHTLMAVSTRAIQPAGRDGTSNLPVARRAALPPEPLPLYVIDLIILFWQQWKREFEREVQLITDLVGISGGKVKASVAVVLSVQTGRDEAAVRCSVFVRTETGFLIVIENSTAISIRCYLSWCWIQSPRRHFPNGSLHGRTNSSISHC